MFGTTEKGLVTSPAIGSADNDRSSALAGGAEGTLPPSAESASAAPDSVSASNTCWVSGGEDEELQPPENRRARVTRAGVVTAIRNMNVSHYDGPEGTAPEAA
jgi:hypothetical protein